MSFDPCNCPLKVWESIGILTPKVGVHLEVWGFIPSHSPTLRASFLAHTFASLYLGCEPKVRVASFLVKYKFTLSLILVHFSNEF
jgi:sterol desaturase/sphingolipid hydroxylase (fatty acid hydroxylase superfamily)